MLAALPLRAAPPLLGEPVSLGDITLQAVSMPEGESTHGYSAYVFFLTNTATQAHEVTLRIPALSTPHGEDNIRALTRTVTVPAGGNMRVVLRQPAWPPIRGQGLSVFIDGREMTEGDKWLPVNIVRNHGGGYGSMHRGIYSPTGIGSYSAFVLASDSVPDPAIKRLSGVPPAPREPGKVGLLGLPPLPGPPPRGPGGAGRPAPPRSPRGGRPFGGGPSMTTQGPLILHARQPIAFWSPDAIDYSRYDGIIVTADDLRDPAAVLAGLWQYVENGGTLLVLGPGKLPASWQSSAEQVPGYTRYEPGFGVCLVVESGNAANVGPFRDEKGIHPGPAQDSWQETAKPWQTELDIARANEELPVVDNVGIPVRGLLVLMLLFTIVIGPLNFYVLARKGRRLWLLWTVPLIAFLTCTAVFGYMLISEGWSGHLRNDTLTVIDHVTGRAATIGWTGFYSPLTPGGGLHFSTDTELLPQRRGDWRTQRSQGTPCTLDWSHDQHLASGWVTARIPAHFLVRKGTSVRERVTITGAAGGTPAALNGLGADIRQLWYADAQGRIFTANNVIAGAQVALADTHSLLPAPPDSTRLRTVYRDENWLTPINDLHHDPVKLLRPRSYVAVLDASPFLEDGLANARYRRQRALVLGLLQGDRDAR